VFFPSHRLFPLPVPKHTNTVTHTQFLNIIHEIIKCLDWTWLDLTSCLVSISLLHSSRPSTDKYSMQICKYQYVPVCLCHVVPMCIVLSECYRPHHLQMASFVSTKRWTLWTWVTGPCSTNSTVDCVVAACLGTLQGKLCFSPWD
jgi:hypothetical protein